MELVGSDVKQYRNHNTTFKLTHVKKEEDKFWEKMDSRKPCGTVCY